MPRSLRGFPWRWIAATAAVGIALSTASAQPGGGGGGPPAARVVVDVVRLETIEQQRPVTGELQATRRAMLASQENGWVIEFSVREGDLVEAGQVVAKLEDTLARLDVQRAEAVLRKWAAQIAEYEAESAKRTRDVGKLKEARAKGSATDTEVADSETLAVAAMARLDQAKAEMATGEAELGLAQKRLADATIKSPLTGRVARRGTEVGQWLQRGDTVIELVQLHPIEAWLDVPEAVVSRIRKERAAKGDTQSPMEVQIRVASIDEVRIGRVEAILPRADALSRLVPVRVLLDNKDEFLRPGMSITGLVPSGTREATLTVPKDAVLRNDAGAYVYFNAGGVAAIARVEVLFGAGERVAVRSVQLKEGMEVVVEGNERLFPGQPLALEQRGGAAAALGGGAAAATPATGGK